MLLDLSLPRLTLIGLLDVSIFAVAIYILLSIGIRHGSRRGFAVIALFAAIYVLAMRLQMPLSLTVFRIGFSAIIVSIAIVYQDDVRAAAERIGRWILGSQGLVVSDSARIADVLVKAVFRLSDQKTGALIVLQARDALDRLLDGGIDLDAVPSAPLIYSLFDPSSPGHDGAVVMRLGRVAKFAAHLPLAKSGRAEELGTRHHAAVGLSECCDAVVLVVSEERGTVSIAQSGELTEIGGPDELLRRLENFNLYRRENERTVTLRDLFRERLALKLFAVLISVGCWWLVAPDANDVYRTFLVPVEYRNVPKSVRLTQTLTQELKVTMAGSENAFKFLAPSAIVVTVDLEKVANGKRTFTVTPKSVRHPSNLRVSAIEPRSVRVQVQVESQ